MPRHSTLILALVSTLAAGTAVAGDTTAAVCDGDNDGYANPGPLCAGIDCNDADPTIYPGAPELKDGKDNDCDPDGIADEGLLSPGDLVITEILYDSSSSPEELFEWFELFNPTDRPLSLRAWRITDQPGTSQQTILIETDITIGPLDHMVFCRNADPGTNGGVSCGYQYTIMDLDNTADELILDFDGLIVDEVWYDESPWPAAASGSLNLDPAAVGGDNNLPANWCNSPDGPPELSNGDDATPGAANLSCTDPAGRPAITAVHPTNGIDAGGSSLRIIGAGFTGTTDVRVGGSSCTLFTVESDHQINCTTPPGLVGSADVTVTEGVWEDTLNGRFTYTRPASLLPELIDSALTDSPESTQQVAGSVSEAIYARVRENGVTGFGCPLGREYAAGVLTGEIGHGNLGTDPALDGSWTWQPAFCDGPLAGGVEDLFLGILTVDQPGTYSYCYRFSVDGGLTWNYADLDGTANGFSTSRMGTLTVLENPALPDADGDGYLSPSRGGDDCDDYDPLVYPGAPEVRDGKANDCTADGSADPSLIFPGDLVITEILYDSSQSPDENFEWFEVTNRTDRSINLRRWTVQDQPGVSQESFTIADDVVVPPRGFATLCRSATSELNGGIECDYQYDLMTLANTADELILDHDGLTVDEVWYDESVWQAATSGSLNLDPDAVDDDNNLPANWCNSPDGPPELSNGDDATPGFANVSCAEPVASPAIMAVHPDNGIDAGGTSLRIAGSGFTGTTDVRIGATSCATYSVESDHEILCVTPPGLDGAADITVAEGPYEDTLAAQFIYTRQATFNTELVDFASTDNPANLSFMVNRTSPAIYGRVQLDGLTGFLCPITREYDRNLLIAEVGFGELGSNPVTHGSWTWFPAFCDSQTGISEDLFIGTVKADTHGSYSYCYRFSVDAGATWNYADLDGTANGFDPGALGQMIVTACIDADGDSYGSESCGGTDCNDAVAATYSGASEVNDGLDNQCPGDPGHGLADEIGETAGFHNPSDRNEFSWPPQAGATLYEVIRSGAPDFSLPCTTFQVAGAFISDTESPDPGLGFHYLVHALEPFEGSLGRSSDGVERDPSCP